MEQQEAVGQWQGRDGQLLANGRRLVSVTFTLPDANGKWDLGQDS